MDNIIEPTIDYDFSNLYLGPPSTLAGGTYFTKIMYSNNKLLYIQTPKSLTKQGFVKSGKKIFLGTTVHDKVSFRHKFVKTLFVKSGLEFDKYYMPVDVPGRKLEQFIFTVKKMRYKLGF